MKSGGTSRKGLKRWGMSGYVVRGPRGVVLIERERPWRYVVRPESWPRDPQGSFFDIRFNRLYKARAHAELQAGIK